MTEDQLELLLKARQSLAAAQVMLDNGFPDYAASRAYYKMFYIAEAFLAGEGMSFSSHSAVIGLGREFTRTDKVSKEFHRFLLDAQDLRNAGDYGGLNAVTVEQASEQITHAEQFLELAQSAIGTLPPMPKLKLNVTDLSSNSGSWVSFLKPAKPSQMLGVYL